MKSDPTAEHPAPLPPSGRPGTPAALRLMRPRQWVKNTLVFTAPFAAGVTTTGAIFRTAAAFGAFCLVASGTYALNDAVDVESDRAHPTKHRRPVAANEMKVSTAVAIGVVLLAAGLAIAALVSTALLIVVASYVGLTVSYSLWLKRIPVVDLAAVAAGFILRSVAGGAAAPVPISDWFLIVAGFGSLFIVASKRHAEHAELGVDAKSIRSTLGEYSDGFLRLVRAVSAGVCLTGYCLWAFEQARRGGGDLWYQLSIIPFVIGILYYALRVEQGAGASPEDILLGDRTLQAIGLAWLVVFGIGVHVG